MALDLLETFLAVAASKSYSLAGKQLGTPKSTISRHVAALELSLGVPLLHRTTRQVTLTSAGQALYDRAVPLVSALRQTLTDMPERASGESGKLRVTTSVDFGVAFLAPLVPEFLQRYPNITLEVHLSNETVDLVKEGVDIAVRMASGRLRDSTMQSRRVARLTSCLVASPQYLELAAPIRTPKELSSRDWVLFRNTVQLRLEGPLGSVRVIPHGRATFNDMLAVREAVRAGAGVGLLPAMLCAEELESGSLLRVLPKWHPPSTDVWCLWQQSRTVPRKTTAFVEFVAAKLNR